MWACAADVSTLPLALIHSLTWATVPTMATICWALFGIFEIGNLIEEPFTAMQQKPLLPLTEICRTIRRDVRAIAQFSAVVKNASAPTIQRKPKIVKLPENFKELRDIVGNETNRTLGGSNRTRTSGGSNRTLTRLMNDTIVSDKEEAVQESKIPAQWRRNDRS